MNTPGWTELEGVTDRACIAHWWPRVKASGVPVPATEVLETSVRLWRLLEGEEPEGWRTFLSQVQRRAWAVSQEGPWFLRTGWFSGKHAWKDTCYVTDLNNIARHVAALVEESHLVDMMGLPTSVWAVREFLDLDVRFHAFRGRMPIATEARLFFDPEGDVTCVHSYWPTDAIHHADRQNWPELVGEMRARVHGAANALAGLVEENVAPAFAGEAWSVDMAFARDGLWYLTDMAPAERSWHEEACEHGE